MEGIALASDPNYKVLSKALPWISRRVLASPSPEVRSALRALLYKRSAAPGAGTAFRFDRLETLLREAAASPPRRGEAGDAPGSGSTLALLLSPDAAFLRGVLVDELAKALDSGGRVAADAARDGVVAGLDAAAAAAPPLPGAAAPARGVAAAVASIPDLARDDDRAQVDGVARVAAALGDVAEKRGASGDAAGANTGCAAADSVADAARSLLPDPAAGAADALAWLAREAASLPPAAAAVAARLPLDVAARAASRAIARGLRGAADLGPAGDPAPPVEEQQPVAARSWAAAAARAPAAPPAAPTIAPQLAGVPEKVMKPVVMVSLDPPPPGA